MPNVHTFESTGEAYDASQCDDAIRDGDVLVVASEGVIGFLAAAWPIAIVFPDDDPGEFHSLTPENAGVTVIHGTDYAESVKLCRDTAHSDADITGNTHWRDA